MLAVSKTVILSNFPTRLLLDQKSLNQNQNYNKGQSDRRKMLRAANDKPKKKCSNCLKGGKTRMTKLQVVLIFESDWLRKCYKFSDLSRGKAHVKQNKINPLLLLRLC